MPIRKAVGNLLTGLCLLLFLALSGFQPSASRGAAMYGVLLLADSTGRRSDGLNSLGLAVLAVWEVRYRRHPERFWTGSNRLLQCGRCQEQLCRFKHPRSPRFR